MHTYVWITYIRILLFILNKRILFLCMADRSQSVNRNESNIEKERTEWKKEKEASEAGS